MESGSNMASLVEEVKTPAGVESGSSMVSLVEEENTQVVVESDSSKVPSWVVEESTLVEVVVRCSGMEETWAVEVMHTSSCLQRFEMAS